MEGLKSLDKLIAKPFIVLVIVYQHTLSPDHGLLRGLYPYGYCKFHPTCSMYARQVLDQQGISGIFKIIRRLSKCRPGVAPSVDLP